MHRSRIVQTLNVPHTGEELFRQLGVGRVKMQRVGPSLAAALLDGLFEQSARFPETRTGSRTTCIGPKGEPNLESLGYSLSYSLDGIQGITVEDFSYIALIPWSTRA